MAGEKATKHLLPAERASQTEQRQAGLSWPIAVDLKLDQLLATAIEAGERTSRREIVATLVALCDLDGDELGDLLRRYRRLTVGALLSAQPDTVVEFTAARSGPRTRRSAG